MSLAVSRAVLVEPSPEAYSFLLGKVPLVRTDDAVHVAPVCACYCDCICDGHPSACSCACDCEGDEGEGE